MAAGLGFKDFVTGEVLTAADVDGYLMQGVWVFASAAARDAAVTSPQEGNFAYLKDTNVTTYYTGSAWANLDTTGMTNPMTTTGDTIYSSSGSTPARLGIGTTGQVLTVAAGVPSWATPAGGGKILQVVSSGTTTPQSLSVTTSFADGGLSQAITPSSATSKILVMIRQPTYTAQARNASVIKSNIMRGATQIAYTEFQTRLWIPGGAAATELGYNFTDIFIDSPATTSSTTYKVQYKSDSTFTLELQYQNSNSQIILMEIGA
jgi:hypothetical protein